MKVDIIFECSECGKQMVKWMGRCPGCGQWNTVVEKQPTSRRGAVKSAVSGELDSGSIISIAEIQNVGTQRLKTGIRELDRVLGGGIVNRSLVLVGGDPGIGKSTLLLQTLGALADAGEQVLYISGEESAEQLKMRADRLAVKNASLMVLVENELEAIIGAIERSDCSVVVLDSVQSVFSRSSESTAGSVAQVRHVASRVMDSIKGGSAACFIVGHVTKDGNIAGPKVLEHMVDTVLYFEGERNHAYRILRAVKNRFGSASEIGVFEMSDKGLEEVENPSQLFLSERPEGVPGSVVTALVEGTRPILAEVQALVSGPVAGQGRRTCLGTDSQRLALIIAVLEKKLGLTLGDQDIFLNAAGGVRATEPAGDLAIAAALLSSYTERTVSPGTVLFGELGLAGEIRRVSRAEARVSEAVRLGFNRILLPVSNAESASSVKGAKIMTISHVNDLGPKLFD